MSNILRKTDEIASPSHRTTFAFKQSYSKILKKVLFFTKKLWLQNRETAYLPFIPKGVLLACRGRIFEVHGNFWDLWEDSLLSTRTILRDFLGPRHSLGSSRRFYPLRCQKNSQMRHTPVTCRWCTQRWGSYSFWNANATDVYINLHNRQVPYIWPPWFRKNRRVYSDGTGGSS